MALTPGLERLFQRAIDNSILSRNEMQGLDRLIQTPDDAQWVVGQLKERLENDGLELEQFTRRPRLDAFLGKLDARFGLDLGKDAPAGKDLVDALLAARGAKPVDPVVLKEEAGDPIQLPKKSFGSQALTLHGEKIQLGEASFGLRLDAPPSDAELEARLGLLKAGQLTDIPTEDKVVVAGALLDGLEASFPLDMEAKGKFRLAVGAMAAAGSLADLSEVLDGPALDRIEKLVGDAPNPMVASLLIRALEEAGGADRAAKLESPEAKDHLLETFDALVSGTFKLGYGRLEEPARQVLLKGVAFARNEDATKSLFEGAKIYPEIDPKKAWTPEVTGHLASVLETYVDSYPQADYVFGTFAGDAPKEVAKVTNARVSAALTASFDGAAPTLGSAPLSAAQADAMKAFLPGIANEADAEKIAGALAEAQDMFSGQLRGRWSDAPMPEAPISDAAFALFVRHAQNAFDARESTPNGMMDAKALGEAVKEDARAMAAALMPILSGLNAEPPRFGEIPTTKAAAGYLKDLLQSRMKSVLSPANLVEAAEVFAKSNGGKLDGAAFEGLTKLVTRYAQEFPGSQQFDFNKLGRLAQFAVEGRDIPLSTLNGQKVGMAAFYGAVASSVAGAAAKGQAKYGWMADRWGFRARESVELVDVIAQKTAEGEGPVKALRDQFPGRSVTVVATGASGAHQQLLFEVEGKGQFAQASDGTIAALEERIEPILFTASIREDGAFDVKTPDTIDTRRWPLQTTYAVGDSIDVFYKDPKANDDWKEKEKFQTAHKILPGEIVGFDTKGVYDVRVKMPGGEDQIRRIALVQIEDANNPHDFSFHGSEFSDVSIHVGEQPKLAELIDGAQPIIAKHLPTGGAMLEMSNGEIAKRQKACVKELMSYVADRMKYPASKDSNPDPASKEYHDIIDGLGWYQKVPLGKLLELERGVCRHQCIAQQLLMQSAGIDSRLASGAANTRSGDYRGLHIWTELATALDERFLSDQTWNDVAIPLWNGAYDVDARRIEMYHRTARYDGQIVA